MSAPRPAKSGPTAAKSGPRVAKSSAKEAKERFGYGGSLCIYDILRPRFLQPRFFLNFHMALDFAFVHHIHHMCDLHRHQHRHCHCRHVTIIIVVMVINAFNVSDITINIGIIVITILLSISCSQGCSRLLMIRDDGRKPTPNDAWTFGKIRGRAKRG